MIELPYLLDWSEVHCNHTQRFGLKVMEWVIWKSQYQERTTLCNLVICWYFHGN